MNYRDRATVIPIEIVSNYKPDCPIMFERWEKLNIEGIVKDYYSINNFGEIKNKRNHLLKPFKTNSGYLSYTLYTGNKDKKYKNKLAHRLVMETFHPVENMANLTVNHNNSDPFDNYEENLSWMTQKENNIHKNLNQNIDRFYQDRRTFSDEQLYIIFSELEKGTSYKNILDKLQIENSDNLRDYIGNIKRGITYRKKYEKFRVDKSND